MRMIFPPGYQMSQVMKTAVVIVIRKETLLEEKIKEEASAITAYIEMMRVVGLIQEGIVAIKEILIAVELTQEKNETIAEVPNIRTIEHEIISATIITHLKSRNMISR